jgi:hypothetical protein
MDVLHGQLQHANPIHSGLEENNFRFSSIQMYTKEYMYDTSDQL